jgi:hypothetical protein
MPRLLLDAYEDGTTEWLSPDDGEGRFVVETRADVEPLLERNKRLALAEDGGWSRSREWRRVASFPPIAVEIFRRRWGADPFARGNEKLLRRLLNDPDLRHFRTAPGRV